MTRPIPSDLLRKVRKLALLLKEVRQSRWAVPVTRLTTLNSLCEDAATANRFVTYLARKTLDRVARGQGHAAHPDTPEQRVHRELMTGALAEMEAWIREPADDRRERLRDLLVRMRDQQNEYENIQWGVVRLVKDWDLLLVEYVLNCQVSPARERGSWAYQTARHYAERYDPGQGTGLASSSAPLVQDIADFWIDEYDMDAPSVEDLG